MVKNAEEIKKSLVKRKTVIVKGKKYKICSLMEDYLLIGEKDGTKKFKVNYTDVE